MASSLAILSSMNGNPSPKLIENGTKFVLAKSNRLIHMFAIRMKKRMTIGLSVALSVICVIVGCVGCAMHGAKQQLAARDHVHTLVSEGQDIADAQRILRDKGYRLLYDKPRHVTQAKDYVVQQVVIGDNRIKPSDTFFYALTGGRNPLRKESPYVMIEAGNDGIITKVE